MNALPTGSGFASPRPSNRWRQPRPRSPARRPISCRLALFAEVVLDLANHAHDLLDRSLAIGSVPPIHFLKLGLKPVQLLFPFAAEKIPDDVTGGRESGFLLARFYPSELVR